MKNPVKDYYDRNARREWERLERPLSAIEFASTLRLIDKYFPARGRVCDIGSGPGRYALALAEKGYAVSLLDLSDENIALARAKFKEKNLPAEAFIVADARDLAGLASAAFDAALLLGPLYHVTDAGQRAAILRELRRVLKPGGLAIVAYLNSWGLLKTGLSDFPAWYREIDKVRALLGEQSFSAAQLSDFTEAHWSTPEAALREVAAAGFEIVSQAGAQGFAGGLGHLLERIAAEDPQAYQNIVKLGAETCELLQYRDATEHLLVVVRKSTEKRETS